MGLWAQTRRYRRYLYRTAYIEEDFLHRIQNQKRTHRRDIEERTHREKQMEEIADNDNIIEYLISKTNTFRNKPRRDDEKFFQIHFDMKKYYPELFDKHCRLIKEDSEVNTLGILNMGIAQGLFREDMDLTLTKKLISEIFSNMLDYSNTNKIPFIHMMDFCMDTMFRIVCNSKGLEYYNSISNKQ